MLHSMITPNILKLHEILCNFNNWTVYVFYVTFDDNSVYNWHLAGIYNAIWRHTHGDKILWRWYIASRKNTRDVLSMC